jgi:hypothetical protein
MLDVLVLVCLALAQGWLLGSLQVYLGDEPVQTDDDLVE